MTTQGKQLEIIRRTNGEHDWRATFRNATEHDWMILPIQLRSRVHGAANARGLQVNVSLRACRTKIKVTFVTSDTKSRKRMIWELGGMPLNHLRAIYSAAKQGGLIS